jgi:uncharacterized protein (DUF58 family)
MARQAEGLRNWWLGFSPPEQGAIVLVQRRVYIVPSRLGLLFGGTLTILLIGSINYALSLGFALTFLLAGMGVAGMVHTVRNLAHLSVRTGRCDPVFAGEAAGFRLYLDNARNFDRPEILLRQLASGAQRTVDVPAAGAADPLLAVPTTQRGWLPLGRVMLETRFPLGLFRAWSYVEPDCQCLVYPRPDSSPLPALASSPQAGGTRTHAQGSDDFSGLRAYQLADSPRHVAWKSVARTDDMLTKQFAGEALAELWLDFAVLPAGLGLEARLSRLAGWAVSAERAGARYGLRLPGFELQPDQGELHCAECLRALALYDEGKA